MESGWFIYHRLSQRQKNHWLEQRSHEVVTQQLQQHAYLRHILCHCVEHQQLQCRHYVAAVAAAAAANFDVAEIQRHAQHPQCHSDCQSAVQAEEKQQPGCFESVQPDLQQRWPDVDLGKKRVAAAALKKKRVAAGQVAGQLQPVATIPLGKWTPVEPAVQQSCSDAALKQEAAADAALADGQGQSATALNQSRIAAVCPAAAAAAESEAELVGALMAAVN